MGRSFRSYDTSALARVCTLRKIKGGGVVVCSLLRPLSDDLLSLLSFMGVGFRSEDLVFSLARVWMRVRKSGRNFRAG